MTFLSGADSKLNRPILKLPMSYSVAKASCSSLMYKGRLAWVTQSSVMRPILDRSRFKELMRLRVSSYNVLRSVGRVLTVSLIDVIVSHFSNAWTCKEAMRNLRALA